LAQVAQILLALGKLYDHDLIKVYLILLGVQTTCLGSTENEYFTSPAGKSTCPGRLKGTLSPYLEQNLDVKRVTYMLKQSGLADF